MAIGTLKDEDMASRVFLFRSKTLELGAEV